MALESLIIQTKFQYSDRELVEQITENPYLQYFIGLPGYQDEPPFDASTLVPFQKRLTHEIIMDVKNTFWNTMIMTGLRRPPVPETKKHLKTVREKQ